jgi:hypothetical protein
MRSALKILTTRRRRHRRPPIVVDRARHKRPRYLPRDPPRAATAWTTPQTRPRHPAPHMAGTRQQRDPTRSPKTPPTHPRPRLGHLRRPPPQLVLARRHTPTPTRRPRLRTPPKNRPPLNTQGRDDRDPPVLVARSATRAAVSEDCLPRLRRPRHTNEMLANRSAVRPLKTALPASTAAASRSAACGSSTTTGQRLPLDRG